MVSKRPLQRAQLARGLQKLEVLAARESQNPIRIAKGLFSTADTGLYSGELLGRASPFCFQYLPKTA